MKKKLWISVIAIAACVVIGFVAAVLIPILTHQNGGASGYTETTAEGARLVAKGDDGRTRTLEARDSSGELLDVTRIRPGEKIVVRGSGYNPDIGIYVSFCRIPETEGAKFTPCLGEVPASEAEAEAQNSEGGEGSSAWITNDFVWRVFATGQFEADGSFEAHLIIPESSGNGVDCRKERCGLVTRADHTASGDRIQDMAIPLQFAE